MAKIESVQSTSIPQITSTFAYKTVKIGGQDYRVTLTVGGKALDTSKKVHALAIDALVKSLNSKRPASIDPKKQFEVQFSFNTDTHKPESKIVQDGQATKYGEESLAEKFVNASTQRDNAKYWYSDDDITEISKQLPFKNVYRTDALGANYLNNETLQDIKKNADGKPILIPYNTGSDQGTHWVALCIIGTTCFYKDSLQPNAGNLKDLQNKLTQNYKVIVHQETEQRDPNSCGVMALENLRRIAEHINNDENFEKQFQNIKFCTQNDVLNLRKEFGELYDTQVDA